MTGRAVVQVIDISELRLVILYVYRGFKSSAQPKRVATLMNTAVEPIWHIYIFQVQILALALRCTISEPFMLFPRKRSESALQCVRLNHAPPSLNPEH